MRMRTGCDLGGTHLGKTSLSPRWRGLPSSPEVAGETRRRGQPWLRARPPAGEEPQTFTLEVAFFRTPS